jgi:hypothetical protein
MPNFHRAGDATSPKSKDNSMRDSGPKGILPQQNGSKKTNDILPENNTSSQRNYNGNIPPLNIQPQEEYHSDEDEYEEVEAEIDLSSFLTNSKAITSVPEVKQQLTINNNKAKSKESNQGISLNINKNGSHSDTLDYKLMPASFKGDKSNMNADLSGKNDNSYSENFSQAASKVNSRAYIASENSNPSTPKTNSDEHEQADMNAYEDPRTPNYGSNNDQGRNIQKQNQNRKPDLPSPTQKTQDKRKPNQAYEEQEYYSNSRNQREESNEMENEYEEQGYNSNKDPRTKKTGAPSSQKASNPDNNYRRAQTAQNQGNMDKRRQESIYEEEEYEQNQKQKVMRANTTQPQRNQEKQRPQPIYEEEEYHQDQTPKMRTNLSRNEQGYPEERNNDRRRNDGPYQTQSVSPIRSNGDNKNYIYTEDQEITKGSSRTPRANEIQQKNTPKPNADLSQRLVPQSLLKVPGVIISGPPSSQRSNPYDDGFDDEEFVRDVESKIRKLSAKMEGPLQYLERKNQDQAPPNGKPANTSQQKNVKKTKY